MINKDDKKENSLKKFYKKAKGKNHLNKTNFNKSKILSLALLAGIGISLTSSAVNPQAAIDLSDRRAYTTLSLYNPETLQFEYVISTEEDENWYNAGYEVERSYTDNVSGNSTSIREGWEGLVSSKRSSSGVYSETAKNTSNTADKVAEAYPYSWNGSYHSYDEGVGNLEFSTLDWSRLSASGQDYNRANVVLKALTDELNGMLNYITRGELLDVENSSISTNDGYLRSLQRLSNNIVTVASTGESVSGYITDGKSSTCTPTTKEGEVCYPYTIEPITNESYSSLTNEQKTKITDTNASLVYSDNNAKSGKSIAKQYIRVEATNNGVDYLGNDATNTVAETGEVYLYTAPKGYDDDETLNGYIATNLSNSENATSYKDLGILNYYTIPMMISQSLNIYTNEEYVANSAFDIDAFKSDIIQAENTDSGLSGFITNIGNFLYRVVGAYPMNEAISPFENGMTYDWVFYFTPPALIGLFEVASTIVIGLTIMILTIITLRRVFYVRQNKYNAEEMKPFELFKDVVSVALAAVVNVIFIPFYVNLGRTLTAIFVLLGTPPGMAPGTYEIGAGLFGTGLSQLGYIIAWAMQIAFTGYIIFALFNIMIRFLLGSFIALGFFENKEGTFWSKFFEYHLSLLWLCAGKFALWGLGYAILANLQYREDLGIFMGVVLISAINNLPALIEKMLGLKFHTLEDGFAHVGAGVAAAGSAIRTTKNGAKWGGRATAHAKDGSFAKNKENMESLQNRMNATKEKMEASGGGTKADAASLAQDTAAYNKLRDKHNSMVQSGQRWNTFVAPFVGGRVDAGRWGNEVNETSDRDGGVAGVNNSLEELNATTGEGQDEFNGRLAHQQEAIEAANNKKEYFDPEANNEAWNNLSQSEKDNYAKKFNNLGADDKLEAANVEALRQVSEASNEGEALKASALAEKTAKFEDQRKMNASIGEQKLADIRQDKFKDLTAGEMSKVDSSDTFNNGGLVRTPSDNLAGSSHGVDVSGDIAGAGFADYQQGINNGRAYETSIPGKNGESISGAAVDVSVPEGFAKDLVNGNKANPNNKAAHIYNNKAEVEAAMANGTATGGYYKSNMGDIRQVEFVAGGRATSAGELVTKSNQAGQAQIQVESSRRRTLESTRDTNESIKGLGKGKGGRPSTPSPSNNSSIPYEAMFEGE